MVPVTTVSQLLPLSDTTKIFSYRNYFIVKIICPNLVTCYLEFLCLWWQLPIHYSITCQLSKLSFQLGLLCSQIITVSFLKNLIQCWNKYLFFLTKMNIMNNSNMKTYSFKVILNLFSQEVITMFSFSRLPYPMSASFQFTK